MCGISGSFILDQRVILTNEHGGGFLSPAIAVHVLHKSLDINKTVRNILSTRGGVVLKLEFLIHFLP